MIGAENNESLSERQIREEIRQTGNEIAESLGTIRERLSSEQMKKKAFHEAVSAVAVRIERAGFFLGRHPVPALLGGILFGWLTLRRHRRRL